MLFLFLDVIVAVIVIIKMKRRYTAQSIASGSFIPNTNRMIATISAKTKHNGTK